MDILVIIYFIGVGIMCIPGFIMFVFASAFGGDSIPYNYGMVISSLLKIGLAIWLWPVAVPLFLILSAKDEKASE